jgi:tetratricopeptide (TPR) repeat protein
MRLTAVVLLLFFSRLLPAGEALSEREDSSIAELLRHPHKARGDTQAYFASLLDTASASPSPAVAEFALRLAADIPLDEIQINDTHLTALNSLADAVDKDQEIRRQASALLSVLLERRGKFIESASANRKSGLVANWFVAGSYGDNLRADYYRQFSPESPAANQDLWKPLPYQYRAGFVYPLEYVYPRRGVVYASAYFETQAAGKLSVLVVSDNPFIVFLDRQPVFSADRLRENIPDEITLEVELPAGRHQLMLKLGLESKSTEVKIFLWGNNTGAVKFLKTPVEPAVAKKPYAVSVGRDRLLEKISGSRQTGSTLAESVLSGLLGDKDESLRLSAVAAESPDKSGFASLNAAQAYYRYSDFSYLYRRGAAEKSCARAVEYNPALAPALVMLGELQAARGEYGQAFSNYRKALAINPVAFASQRALFRLLCSRKFFPEANELLAKILSAHAATVAAHRLALDFGRETGRPEIARAALENLVALDATDAGARLLLQKFRFRAGLPLDRRQLTLLALGDRLPPPLAPELIGLYQNSRKVEDALACCGLMLKRFPGNAELWRLMGDVYLQNGQKDFSLQAYDRSLSLAPGQRQLQAFLHQELLPATADFWEPFRVTAEKLIEQHRDETFSGSTARYLDQSVVLVNPDGSCAKYTHVVARIVSQRGVRDYSKVRFQGELISARTILGESGIALEPLVFPGSDTLTMPQIAPGNFVDYEYLQEIPAPDDHALSLPTWYFRSPAKDEDFLLSEYAVIAPPDYPLVHVSKNCTQYGVRFLNKKTGDGRELYVWSAAGVPAQAPETGSLHISERLPFVRVGSKSGWREVGDQLAESVLGKTKDSFILRRFVEEAGLAKMTLAERISFLHAYVCRNISSANTKSSAAQILLDRRGDRDLLLLALLSAAGIEADYCAARQPDNMLYPALWELPSPSQFPLRLVSVKLPGSPRAWLDTRFRYSYCAGLPEDIAGGSSLLLIPGKSEFATLAAAAPDAFVTDESIDAKISADFSLLEFSGGRTVRGREGLILAEESEKLSFEETSGLIEKSLGKFIPGAEVSTVSIARGVQGKPYADKFSAKASLNGDGRTLLPLLLSPLPLLPPSDVLPSRRKTGYHLDRYVCRSTRIVIELPVGCALAKIPPDVILKNGFGDYSLSARREGSRLTIIRKASFPPQKIALADWPDFVKLAEEIAWRESFRLALAKD